MSSTYESLSSVYWSEREYRDRTVGHSNSTSGQRHYHPKSYSQEQVTNGHSSRSTERTPRPTSSASSSRRRREQEENIGGVKCVHCDRYITGKVLQAGENSHFHPTCARCTKCGDPFGDGEEMFMQGAAIWHPRCGPGPEGDDKLVHQVCHIYSHYFLCQTFLSYLYDFERKYLKFMACSRFYGMTPNLLFATFLSLFVLTFIPVPQSSIRISFIAHSFSLLKLPLQRSLETRVFTVMLIKHLIFVRF